MEERKEKVVIIIPADENLAAGREDIFHQKRVAAYCRVSTDEDEQLNSYDAQCRYYRDKINMNREWRLVDIFADEGITGTSTKKREDFKKMIKLCEKGKIDVIITKSISRFARNTVDTLVHVRKLKAMGIAVIFEKEGIDTSKMTDEMLLTTMSMFAQAESESISKNVAAGIRYTYRAGKVSYRYPIFGFTPGPDKIPVINEEQAVHVRAMFEMYRDGKSTSQIQDYLEKNKVPTVNGKSKWCRNIIIGILRNEKYVGDVLLQKTYVADVITRKVLVNNGQLPKYLIKNAHPAIVERSLFNAVQEEIARRESLRKITTDELEQKGKYSKFALTELLVCDECGTNYRRVTWSRAGGKKIVWRCVNRIENATKYCKNSPAIEESLLHAAILRIINRTINDDTALQMLQQVLTRTYSDARSPTAMYAAEAKIKELRAMMSELIDLAVKTSGDTDRYETEFENIGRQIREYTEVYESEKRIIEAQSTCLPEVDAIYESICQKGYQMHTFDDSMVRKLFDCIKVTPDRTIKAYFKGSKKPVEEPIDLSAVKQAI